MLIVVGTILGTLSFYRYDNGIDKYLVPIEQLAEHDMHADCPLFYSPDTL